MDVETGLPLLNYWLCKDVCLVALTIKNSDVLAMWAVQGFVFGDVLQVS